MKHFVFGLVALIGLCGGRAEAASIFANYGAGAPAGSSATVGIAEFNPSLGTLTGVTIYFEGSPPADVFVSNGSARFTNIAPAPVGGVDLTVGTNVSISGAGFSVSETLSVASRQSFPPGAQIILTLDKDISTASVAVGSSFLSSYVGTGTTDIHFSRSLLSATSSNASVLASVLNQGNFGGVFRVQYDYTPTPAAPAVPEPGSVTLLGLGALGMLGYRFRRRKSDAGPVAVT